MRLLLSLLEVVLHRLPLQILLARITLLWCHLLLHAHLFQATHSKCVRSRTVERVLIYAVCNIPHAVFLRVATAKTTYWVTVVHMHHALAMSLAQSQSLVSRNI